MTMRFIVAVTVLAVSFSSHTRGDVVAVAEDFDGNSVIGLNPSGGLQVNTVVDPVDATNTVGEVTVTGGGQWQSLIGAADPDNDIDYNLDLPAGTFPGIDTITFKYRLYIPSAANGGTAVAGTSFGDGDKSNSLIRVNGSAPDAYPPSTQYWVGMVAYDEWLELEVTEVIPEFNNLSGGGLDLSDPTSTIWPIWSIHIAANATPDTQTGLFGYIDDLEVSFSESPLAGGACDFDLNLQCDIRDLDLLYDNFGSPFLDFDVDSNGTVDNGDIGAWLILASDPANPYLNGTKTFVIGDVDLDGDVDSTDLGLMLNQFGDTSNLKYGDGNISGDANVDSGDLGLLLNNFGATSAAAAVPEPRAFALLLVAAMCAVGMSRRR